MTWLLLASAIVAGGGHAASPLPTIIIETLGVATLALLLAARGGILWSKNVRIPLALLIFMIALPLAQLIPLPEPLYTKLPGRLLVQQTLQLTGATSQPLPLSLSPDDTLGCALALLPSIAVFLATISLPPGSEKSLARIIIACALASALWAAWQAAGGVNSPLYLYERLLKGVPTGLFGNRNHQADMMTAGVLFAGALTARAFDKRDFGLFDLAVVALVPILIIANVATLSRTGSALLFPAMVVVLLLFRSRPRASFSPTVLAAIGLAAVVVVTAYFLAPSVFHRFTGFQEDDRFAFWPDVIYAIRQFAPWGSGLGTFQLVFNSVERLSFVDPAYVNNAHNDYFELALETGVVGIAGVAAFLMWFAWASVQVWRRKAVGTLDLLARASTGMIGVLLTHSIVDYPLRTKALAAVFATACGLIVRSNMYAPRMHDAASRRHDAMNTSSIHVVPSEPPSPESPSSSSVWRGQPNGTDRA